MLRIKYNTTLTLLYNQCRIEDPWFLVIANPISPAPDPIYYPQKYDKLTGYGHIAQGQTIKKQLTLETAHVRHGHRALSIPFPDFQQSDYSTAATCHRSK
jgi:hypothetical protein